MPIVNMPIDTLLRLVNPDGRAALREEQIPERLHEMGCEVDEVTATQQSACVVCQKVFERTEAQGPPLACSNCGADFRERADLLEPLGESRVVRIDMLAVRPDIFDPGGMARAMRAFLGIQTGLAEYEVAPPIITVKVDPKLSRDESYRPYIACAVLRNVRLDNERIKMLMNLQEDLHWALGRNRKLASIGVYDLNALEGDMFSYEAVAPDGMTFVPLGFDPNNSNSRITPRDILEKHKTGQAFAHLLRDFTAYPLLRDSRGTVLSMPPIINSEDTRVTMNSRQFFVDVTGTSQRSAERALNILVTSLKELMPEIAIEAVTIDAPDGKRMTPDLSPAQMRLGVREASETIGIPLDASMLRDLLERMGYGVESEPRPQGRGPTEGDASVSVRVPAWRNDVMHAVDLIEDAAIAYGYESLTPELVPTFTVGEPRAIEERSAVARRVFAGLGFHQVMTLTLTSEPAAFGKWRIEPDERAVRIENPISVEQTICRVSLLPGLLETLAINKQHDLPQYLFEVGDCCFFDEAAETGAREERFAAAAMIGTHVGYADIRAVADAFAHEMGAALAYEPIEHASSIPGRAAAVLDSDGRRVGWLGEVHPEVIENYGLRHPIAVLETSLAKLLGL
jgi:phenylalanyl-tRNA synthetase beta chain